MSAAKLHAEKANGLKAEEKPKAAGASPRPTDADQSGERIAAAPAGPRNDEGGERIAAAPAGPRNDEAANAISPRHSEEADGPTREDEGSVSAAPGTVTRAGLLEMAKGVVCGEREKQYGSPEDSFRAIADYWTVYLRQTGSLPEHRELTSEDAAIMMILLKVARQAGRGKLDNWIDIAGYAACGAEITAEVEDAV